MAERKEYLSCVPIFWRDDLDDLNFNFKLRWVTKIILYRLAYPEQFIEILNPIPPDFLANVEPECTVAKFEL